MSIRNEVLAVLHDESIPERLNNVELYIENDKKVKESMIGVSSNRITQWLMIAGILANLLIAIYK